MSVSIREIARSINTSLKSFRLRQLLELEKADIHLHVINAPFSILTYNVALIPDNWYLGTDREGALMELIARIRVSPPDVVGLCEVFSDGERAFIRARLSDIYKHFREGPDEDELVEEDGGLLLLSKHPILASHDSIYRQCAGVTADCLSNKGVIHIRMQPPNSPMPYDVYYSHTQNIEEDGGKEALYSQLTHMGEMAHAYGDPHSPMLILGDLNVPGENPKHYNQLIQRLMGPVDLWLAQSESPPDGFTYASDNNFYEDAEDIPKKNQRLDYILMTSGQNFTPILKSIEILKWSHKGHQISDHYGLLARFDHLVEVGVSLTGSISAVRARIKSFHCIEETDQIGPDDVLFTLALKGSNGKSVPQTTNIFKEVDTGEAKAVNMQFVQLNGDPGNSIDVIVTGTEFDDLSANESLGKSSITLSRTDLLLNQGGSILRFMPFLTGDGGEYSLLVEVTVN